MNSSAPYKCQSPWPKEISDDPDITGYGVVTNYVATAGIAVSLILMYFFVIYDPALDPFRNADEDPPNPLFRPNPVDTIFLRTLRKIPKRFLGDLKIPYNKLERSFLRCILAMSDVQLITGLSILISGFVQLRQGLPSYHWMAVIDLAWFSSITHLACLTLLHNYLYNHSLERMLRFMAMAGLAILLVVALSFTSTYWWASTTSPMGSAFYSDTETATHAAICHLGVVGSIRDSEYITMVFSMLLIMFGFTSRVAKLYKVISVSFMGQAKIWLSTWARRLLRVVFTWCCLGSSRHGLKRTLLYRPLLAVFFSARLFIDLWSSMLLEVSFLVVDLIPLMTDSRCSQVVWLFIGFTWGTIRLMTLLFDTRDIMSSSSMLRDSNDENSHWGFGQVVAIVLLIAPLVTFLELFNKGGTADISCGDHVHEPLPLGHQPSSLMILPLTNLGGSIPKDPDDPDSDWNDHIETLGTAVIYITTMCITFAGIILGIGAFESILTGFQALMISIFMALLNVFGLLLFSLMIESDLSGTPSWGRKLLHLVNVQFFGLSAFCPFIIQSTIGVFDDHVLYSVRSLSWIGNYSLIIFPICFYILCLVIIRFVR
ncbi:hypothetical protein N7517_000275 [Penicillium concentricum]|uniref:Transmembrane protein n=1 Tax=Penicillium concentricum TaxID=293559 RepID=A0A9W9SR73_9EURO|nr:uncharacterized protein N7517_000275 [Penicillium concentricum]KAJ5382364.1 hypothetical protein N7517_000275 [Penicillium concentricum]